MKLTFTGASDRRAFLDKLLSHGAPSECHHRIAQFMSEGFVRYVLTTNFDKFLETALFLNSPSAVHGHIYGETLTRKQLISDALHIVKLHGDLLYEDLGNLEQEMDARVDEAMMEAVGDLLEGAALLIVGYGCQDSNIRRMLEKIASSKQGMSEGFFFAAYDSSEANIEAVQNIIKIMVDSNKPCGTIVGKDLGLTGKLGADVLLQKIMDGVDLAYRGHVQFGLGKSNLPLYQRLEKIVTALGHDDVPVPSKGTAERVNIDSLVSDVVKNLSQNDVVVYSDNDPLRRKLVVNAVIDRFEERAIYFSDRLSAEPARQSLWNRAQHFTASQFGIEHRRADMEQLCRIHDGAVVIWDDLDLSHLPPDEGYGKALRNLFPITRYRGEKNDGASPSLVITTPTPTPSSVVTKLIDSRRNPRIPHEKLPTHIYVQAPDGQSAVVKRWKNALTEIPLEPHIKNALPYLRKLHPTP